MGKEGAKGKKIGRIRRLKREAGEWIIDLTGVL